MGIFKLNVFIISARRSGTHLITDAIINNLEYERIDESIDYDFLTNDNAESFINEMSKGGRLAWSKDFPIYVCGRAFLASSL